LAQDEQGEIYVAHTVNKSSMARRGRGRLRLVRAVHSRIWGGVSWGAHGLGVRRENGAEVLYHCDINQCKIVKTTLNGESLWAHGYPP